MSAPLSLEIFVGFLIFAAVFASLEHCFPLRRQGLFRPGWRTDVTYYVVGCLVGHLSDGISVGAFVLIRQLMDLPSETVVALQPAWLQFIEIVIIGDLSIYVSHRALHQVPWLWRWHRVHHSSQQLDWLANVRLHPADKIFEDFFKYTPLFLLGFSTAPLLTYTIALAFQGFLNHSNIKLDVGVLRWIIATPQFHHWHHSNDPNSYDKNFAPHLVLFDLLFGTAYIPPDASRPEKYGIAEGVPEGFWGQMIDPLRRPDAPRAARSDTGP